MRDAWTQQLTIGLHNDVAIGQIICSLNDIAVKETIVLITQIAWLIGHSNLLSQAGTQ